MKNNPLIRNSMVAAILALALAGSVRAADVKENWENNCAKCHGVDGRGQTKMGRQLGAKDYTDAKVQDGMKDEEMVKRTREGLKEGSKEKMPAYKDKLSDQEIKDLMAHVRAMKK